jgi:hypothetical protein
LWLAYRMHSHPLKSHKRDILVWISKNPTKWSELGKIDLRCQSYMAQKPLVGVVQRKFSNSAVPASG